MDQRTRPRAEYSSDNSFSLLSISGNIFLSGEVRPCFSYIVIKAPGGVHVINGLTIKRPTVHAASMAFYDRVERIDTRFADRFSRACAHRMTGNFVHGISKSGL